jgi:hypothetical protein
MTKYTRNAIAAAALLGLTLGAAHAQHSQPEIDAAHAPKEIPLPLDSGPKGSANAFVDMNSKGLAGAGMSVSTSSGTGGSLSVTPSGTATLSGSYRGVVGASVTGGQFPGAAASLSGTVGPVTGTLSTSPLGNSGSLSVSSGGFSGTFTSGPTGPAIGGGFGTTFP